MLPPRVIIYGPSKIGISTFCSKIPNAYFLDVGRTIGHIYPEPGRRCSFMWEVNDSLSMITSGEIKCKFLVIDNLYGLENLVMNSVCTKGGMPQDGYFEDIPYGKGPGMVIEELKRFLYTLDTIVAQNKIGIVITANEFIEQRNMAHGPVTFSRPNMITKSTKAQTILEEAYTILTNWADCTLYASLENQVGGQFFGTNSYHELNKDPQDRCLYTERRPTFEAGNRYGLEYKLPFEWSALEKGIQKYFDEKLKSNDNNVLEKTDEECV